MKRDQVDDIYFSVCIIFIILIYITHVKSIFQMIMKAFFILSYIYIFLREQTVRNLIQSDFKVDGG